MIYWLGFAFLVVFALNQIVAFALICAIASLVWLGKLAETRTPALNVKDVLFLAYTPLAFIPVLADPYEGLFWTRIVLYPWLITFVFQNIWYDDKKLSRYMFAILIVSVVIASSMLFQVEPGQYDFSLQRLVSLNRNQGFYYTGDERIGPNTAAYMSGAAVVMLLASIKFQPRNLLQKYGTLAVSLAFLIAAGGRNAWVGTSMCFLLFIAYRPTGSRSRRSRRFLRGLVLAGMAAVVVPAMYDAITTFHGDVFNRRLEGLLNPTEDHNVQVRLLYWARATAMIHERPLGWGFNAYYARYDRSPHNELLGQIVGAGWLGAFAYVLLLSYLWLHILRLPRSLPVADRIRFACLCLLTMTTLAMVTENISRSTMNTFSPIFWTMIGISFGVRGQSIEGRCHDPTSQPETSSSC